MPVYNDDRHVGEAIASILGQTFTDFEFLIVNDGSTDRTAEVIASFRDPRIRLVANDVNRHVEASLNRGLGLARGEYIGIMNSDDVSLPERLRKQVAYLDANPEVGVVGSWIEVFGAVKRKVQLYPMEPGKIRCELLFSSALANPAVMFRSRFLGRHGLKYEESEPVASDWGLWARSCFCFPLANLPETLVRYRVHANSLSRVCTAAQRESERKIDILNLARLGITATEEELSVHRQLGSCQFSQDETFEIRAADWLSRLHRANAATRCYPEPAFSEVLGGRWYGVCRAGTGTSLSRWMRFWQSPYAKPAVRSALGQRLKAFWVLGTLG
jgi:glycosyltransferase involved in cell wall biosynthesis